MPLVTAGYNAQLSGGLSNVIAYIGLNSGDPSTTGTNELTGGSPPYARKAVTWAAVSGGQIVNSGDLTFDIPPSTDVVHASFWSAVTTGTFYGYYPAGGFVVKLATVLASSDVFTSYAHGYSNDDRLLVYDFDANGVPTGLTEGTVYYVISATTDTFKVSTTSGGSSAAITADGQVAVQKATIEHFTGQGSYVIAAGTLVLDARAI